MKPRALGMDVGSTTAKGVVLASDGELLEGWCERHRGRPEQTAVALLERARQRYPGLAIGITGSIGVGLGDRLGATTVHEVHAVARAVRARHPDCRSVVELGGQDAKILFLGETAGDDDTEMNDRCAAGTGATLDRIARRLGWTDQDMAALRLAGDARVAAKCGVFAETDIVNLIKQGASADDVLAALARAIVVQNLAVLTRGRSLLPPVLLLGGPHANLPVLVQAWRERLAELWSTDSVDQHVRVPPHAALFAAIGAGQHVLRGGRSLPRATSTRSDTRTMPGPLQLATSRALEGLRCAAAHGSLRAGPVRVHVGIDAGSTTSKAVLLDEDGELLACSYAPSHGDPLDDARRRLAELWHRAHAAGAEPSVASLGVTGYGADLVGPALGADATSVETLAHARAATSSFPGVDAVVDVGGTDIKVLRLERGRVAGFHVSNQCSAGHGAFLAATAEDLDVDLADYAERALRAERMPRFTVGCSIFMDTDRVTFQRDGWNTDEILAGLAWAVVRNVWELIVPEVPERLGRTFLLTGGTHRNLAVAWAQAHYLRQRVPGARVRVHPHPELCGAIGAAIDAADVTPHRSRFVGLDAMENIRLHAETGEHTRCTRCEIGCARSFVRIESPSAPQERFVLGNACDRGADPDSTGRRGSTHAPDLLDMEARMLFHRRIPVSAPPNPRAPVFGIPRVMALYRSAPLLLHYLRAAGVPEHNLVLTPHTSAELYQRGAHRGVNDPCFPSKLVHAHVDWLLRRHRERPIDVLLMPTITHASIAVHGTAETASCPIVAATGLTAVAALQRERVLEGTGIRPLLPELCLVDHARLRDQLLDAFGPLLGIDARRNEAALEAGLEAQRSFHARCRRAGARVLEKARRRGGAVALVMARPYHADPGVQHGLSTELASRGLPVLGISSLPVDGDPLLDLSGALPEVTNSGCAEKVWAARRIREDPHLVAVDLSSFRCGHDASVFGVLADLLAGSNKPILRLHDMDEDRPSTSFALRIRTFVQSVRRYERDVLRTTTVELAGEAAQ